MKVKVWGARGSIPSPLSSEAIRDKIVAAVQGARGVNLDDPMAVRGYVDSLSPLTTGTVGGNTACISVQAGEQTIILDAGSGIRPLGMELMSGPCGRGQGVVHLLISHVHWDHIQGFPFFIPAFIPGNKIYIYSIHDARESLVSQMQPANFPVSLDYMSAAIQFVALRPGEPVTIGDVRVNTMALPHPGTAYAYRLDHADASFVYASDAEYKQLDEGGLKPFIEFYAGADALVFDSQYTLRESFVKVDWGHSSALIGADIARLAGVKRLLLFHHDPTTSDAALEDILAQTIAYQRESEERPSCEVLIGREGLELYLAGSRGLQVWQHEEGRAAVLQLAGDFDEWGVADLHNRLIEVPVPIVTGGGEGALPGLIVDLGGLTRLSITGLRALIDLRREWEGSPIVLAALSQPVRQVIELSNCMDFFALYPTVEQAVAALEARARLGLPGQMLKERYRIESWLGESEMGAVFRATDTRLDRQVAIKVFSSSYNQLATERFLREAQRIARLSTPGIVSIYDWDNVQGMAYLVMEYASGDTLRALLDEAGTLPPSSLMSSVLDIAIQVLSALEYAHSKGVIHGNLRPQNILVGEEVKLVGFGLRWLEERRRLVDSPLLVDTPDYLAPEQIEGSATDGRADLYALGVILYELVTGRLPFTGTDREIMEQHLRQIPTSPRRHNPELSRSLDHLIVKLLSKRPEQRYASATQVRRVLLSLKRAPTPDAVDPADSVLPAAVRPIPRKFIARDATLVRLTGLWEHAGEGRGKLVLVGGEAGIGKTRLVQELAARVGAGTLLIGHCAELQGSPSYQPFIEICHELVTRTPLADLRRYLAGSAVAVTNLIPEVLELLPELPRLATLEPDQERGRLMQGLTQFFAQVAPSQPPLLLLIEDLHWADPASLQMLLYVARQIGNLPLIIIGTYRDGELERDHPLRELLRELPRFPGYQHVALDRLDREGVRQLLEGIWQQEVPGEWCATIFERTGGNPFYVQEVAQSLMEEGAVVFEDGAWQFAPLLEVRLPQSIRDIVLRRMARMAPATQEVLRLAAVLGQQFAFSELLEVSGQSEEQLLDALDRALERDVIREVDSVGTLCFSHAETQQVIYEELSPLRRRQLHRRAGVALEQGYARNLGGVASQLAHHFIQAGERDSGFTYSLQAARQAQRLYDYENAAIWYHHALSLLASRPGAPTDPVMDAVRRVELYEGLGDMLRSQAHYAQASEAYRAMIAAAEVAGDVMSQPRAWAGLGEMQMRLGNYQASLESAERAESVARDTGDAGRAGLADALFRKGWTLLKLGRTDAAIELARETLAITQELDDDERMAKSLNLLGALLNRCGHFDESTACFVQALALFRRLGDERGVALLLNNMGYLAGRRGDFEAATSYHAEALTIALQTGYRDLEMLLLNNLGAARVGLKAFTEAEEDLRRSIRLAEEAGRPDIASSARRYLAEALLRQGQVGAALATAAQALSLGLAAGEQETIGGAWYVLGLVAAHPTAAQAIADWHTSEPVSVEGIHERLNHPGACFEESARLFARIGAEVERVSTLQAWAGYETAKGNAERGAALRCEAEEARVRLGIR